MKRNDAQLNTIQLSLANRMYSILKACTMRRIFFHNEYFALHLRIIMIIVTMKTTI